ncbi:hypothetical protein [Hymenobacter lapidiphilus]|uniref:Uncharacterized protein n=1 Tax=Hymenobacter lapidiphilus TaxID=2608003 RepID=A0A7Y7U6Y0_9BACT|nr:hypothetical protein [Hymenobacter lapidiphilus]NVO33271.1 hypothetical protein [Hymenobacter lapidiphilus]
MQTAANPGTANAMPTRIYTGPLGRHIARQEATAAEQATIRAMRANIMGMMIEPLFNPAERLRANDSVYQTECVAKLQRWFRNVYRVYKERENSVYLAFNDGSYARLPVAA